MKIEFDPAKDAVNIEKHGLSLTAASDFDCDGAAIVPDLRKDYGEARQIAVGYVGNRLHVAVYTLRDDCRRIISLRKANLRKETIIMRFKKEIDPDNPPLTSAQLRQMRPLRELDPELAEWGRQKKLGRPLKDDPLVSLTIRIPKSDLPKLRATPGFHTKITQLVHQFAQGTAST